MYNMSFNLEEYELMKDVKYRVYVSAIDKALKAFENCVEWHDLISTLTKLIKVIKDHERYHIIPRRIKLSKRLAQCLHSDLPGGVHLRALETYDVIFKCMGTNRLSHELFIFSSGLFPLLGYSTMNVKPRLLQIYETHFVLLGPRLLPGLSGFLNGVFPGLEEGSDHFERTNSLLDRICDGVGPTSFYGCLWECVAGNAAIRYPAITFIITHFNKTLSMEEQLHFVGTNVNVMVKALCCALQDSNVLVQRCSLDLLLVGFPMHNTQLNAQDMINLVTAALGTILRRDNSLYRRLYSWLLGTEVTSSSLVPEHPFVRKLTELEEDSSHTKLYFEMYSKEFVVEGIKATLTQSGADIRPYRLLTSLLDKADIGPIILESVLFDVFRVLYTSCQKEDYSESPKRKSDVLKTANLLFNSLDACCIWQYIGSTFEQRCQLEVQQSCDIETDGCAIKPVSSGVPSILEICQITEFLLSVIPTEVSLDSPGEHLLELLLTLTSLLTKNMDSFTSQQVLQTLNVCRSLLKKMQPVRLKNPRRSQTETVTESYDLVRPSVIRSKIGQELDTSVEENSSPEPLEETTTKHIERNSKESEFGTMFKVFLKEFQSFYVAFIGGGRIVNGSYVPKAFDKLKKSSVEPGESWHMYAYRLREYLGSRVTDHCSKAEDGHGNVENLESCLIVANNDNWEECFDEASNLLVEVSAFPLCFPVTPNDFIVLPPWVKTLLVCCCYLYRNPRLHLIAIRTLLDLLQLCETKADNEEQVTNLLEKSQVFYIQKTTIVVEVITETLWSHLGHLTSQSQIACIHLLHMVLNTFTATDSVELFLGKVLLEGDERKRLRSLMKFIHLWTVGRQLQDGQSKKYFQSSLLKTMDNLLLPDNSPLRLQTESWLSQALMRGDIARLLDPLLLLLLDSATARLGILHVSIQPSVSESITEDVGQDDTSRVYAISSVDGNVIYHVSDAASSKDNFQKRAKWRWKKEKARDKKVFAVTTLKGNKEAKQMFVTEKNVNRDIELPRPNYNQVSLFVNPFNGQDDEDFLMDDNSQTTDSLKNARRFNPSTGEVEMSVLAPSQTSNTISTDSTLSLKFPLKKFVEHDCDESVSADEYFDNHDNSNREGIRIAREIINVVLDSAINKCESRAIEGIGAGVHPLHSHLLLYCGVYDSGRVLYAFKTLKNILQSHPRLFLCCSATSGIVNTSFPSDLLTLLARHRKSVFGRSFDGPLSTAGEFTSTYRSSMYLQVLVSVCLSYARSFYPNLGLLHLTPDDLAGNRLVQLTSIETLTLIFTELLPIVRDSGKGFASYIADVLTQCKVQKIVLHCVMSSLSSIQQQHQSFDRLSARTFTEDVIEFNDSCDEQNKLTEHSRAMQVQLMKLILALIKLEHCMECQRSESTDISNQANNAKEGSDSCYSPGYLIPHQPMFFRAVVSALSIKGAMRSLHSHWTELITASLPYLGSALHHIVMIVINQLCICIEELATLYCHPNSDEVLPPDYAVIQLEALTVLCHYCVLDSPQQVSPLFQSSANSSANPGSSIPNPTQILNNLVHVFTPLPLMQELTKDRNQQLETLLGVRRSVLSRMPRIIASLASLWTAVGEGSKTDEVTMWGSPRIVRSQILEFLSPVSLHHGPCFLAAMAVAWQERSEPGPKPILSPPNYEQLVLVNLVSSIRVMPIDTLVQTVHSVLKQPPAIHIAVQDHCLEVSVLELFLAYMQTCSGVQLKECWGSLLALLRDGILLSPPALFLVLAILNEFVQRSPAFQEKKDQRDLQDITAKLVEACGAVAGACLEQTTWLRRNLSVRDLDNVDDEGSTGQTVSLQQHSVQAQLVLAQVLAPLLDVTYGSQEKEKVANLLIALMANVTPYLKNHQAKYASSFQACSQLLANLSGFPYTRKSWKKDAFDLFIDSSLFQMEIDCLPYWCTIVENLMTHDQTTFRDLMGRISVAQSGFFSSREQEYEQRSQLLKRLAFVIMCSETDQYHKSMRDIQDRLSESLKLPHVMPSVQAQVFFCFRVLLLRMSSHHVTSLWPILISEMVQVFTYIEQELTSDTEEFNSHIRTMSTLDPSWVVNSNNGLNAHGHPHWHLLTLAAAKLLDLAVLLPAHHLPQFQMYRWAFVGDGCTASNNNNSTSSNDFIPHVARISKLMDEKYGPCEVYVRPKEGQLLLTETQVDSLEQLHPFFHSLQARPKSNIVDMAAIEKNILKDFLEKVPTSPSH